jgi:hypothetical protein
MDDPLSGMNYNGGARVYYFRRWDQWNVALQEGKGDSTMNFSLLLFPTVYAMELDPTKCMISRVKFTV